MEFCTSDYWQLDQFMVCHPCQSWYQWSRKVTGGRMVESGGSQSTIWKICDIALTCGTVGVDA